ncbi:MULTISPECIES: hypothetical protein [unclassified Campylobacter]|uniref:hypothetical protein n=1 Tax=unclassified Campylobacter TaxID=2593542 RepID=UPI003D32CA5C
MKSTKYLYGVSLCQLPDASEHFKTKIKNGKKLLNELLALPLELRDDERINEVAKAIKFNEKLLKGEI